MPTGTLHTAYLLLLWTLRTQPSCTIYMCITFCVAFPILVVRQAEHHLRSSMILSDCASIVHISKLCGARRQSRLAVIPSWSGNKCIQRFVHGAKILAAACGMHAKYFQESPPATYYLNDEGGGYPDSNHHTYIPVLCGLQR